jgi:hypothetical protein
MPRAPRRPCPVPGCPDTIGVGERYCTEHASRHERVRGTRQQRGYGREHDRERERWAPIVASGTARCVRCGETIVPGTPWSPDHTDDRSGYLGPAHRLCNLRAAGRAVRWRGNAR